MAGNSEGKGTSSLLMLRKLFVDDVLCMRRRRLSICVLQVHITMDAYFKL